MASQQVEAFRAKLLGQGAKIVKAFILEVDANLRASPERGGTPVKTGHARASWIPSVGQPADGEADGKGSGAHDVGVAALMRYKLSDGPAWESNNTAYIMLLNLGYSHQQAAGFIEAAIERAKTAIEQRFGQTVDVDTAGAGTFSDVAGGMGAENLAEAYSPFGGDE